MHASITPETGVPEWIHSHHSLAHWLLRQNHSSILALISYFLTWVSLILLDHAAELLETSVRHFTFLIISVDELELWWSYDLAVQAGAPTGDIVLCSWVRHFTLTVPLSTQVYKWVPANLMLEVTLWWTSTPSRRSRNTPSCFMLQKLEMNTGLMGHVACMQTLSIVACFLEHFYF